eukprot:m.16267 g.16267  ORF g.16267 m.16267 type:complete len:532 (-) comp4592_c0_seq1:2030-3625(-)
MGTESLGELWPELQSDASCNLISEYQYEKRVESSQEPRKTKNLQLDESIQGIERASIILRDIKVNNLNSDFRMVAATREIADEVMARPKALKAVFSALKGAFTVCDSVVKSAAIPFLVGLKNASSPYPSELLLPWFMHSLENAQDAEEQIAWQDGILQFTSIVSEKMLVDHVWKLAQSSGWMTENVDSRTFSCRIQTAIGKRCMDGKTSLPPKFFDVLKYSMSDIHHAVRYSACESVVLFLTLPSIKTRQYEDIVEVVAKVIVEDSDVSVQGEAIEQVLENFHKLDGATKDTLANAILNSYSHINLDEIVDEAIGHCKHIGKAMDHLHSCLDEAEKEMLMQFFLKMTMFSEDNSVMITSNPKYFAAYNLPAFAVFAKKKYVEDVRDGVSVNQTVLAKCFSALHHTDTHPILRAMVAKGLHEVLASVGGRFSYTSCALSGVMSLLVDTDIRVLSALTENFHKVIRAMVLPLTLTQRDIGAMAGPFKKCKAGFVPSCVLHRTLAAIQRLHDHWRPQRALLMNLLVYFLNAAWL